MQKRFEALVLGTGVAGALAAFLLAKKGRKVALVEPAPATGGPSPPRSGILWHADLTSAWPGWPKNAPLDRRLVQRRFFFLSPEAALSFDYHDEAWASSRSGPWVLEHDRWTQALIGAARQAGAAWMPASDVRRLLVDRSTTVTGAELAGGQISADVTLLDDPRAAGWARASGLALERPSASRSAGATLHETVFRLPRGRVDDRFGVGAARASTFEAVLGFLPRGAMAYGFLYPGQERVVAGVLAHNASLQAAGLKVADVAGMFEAHPAVVAFLRGTERAASSTTAVPTTRSKGPKLYGEGFVQVGEAAGMGLGGGLVLRSLDLAVASAVAGADTAAEAVTLGDHSGRVTSRYVARLSRAGQLDAWRDGPSWTGRVKWNPRLHAAYPLLFRSLFRTMMTERGQRKEHMRELLRSVVSASDVPFISAGLDLVGLIGSL